MFLINLSIPRLVIISDNMYLPGVERLWDVPVTSVCLRELNVGGLIGVNLRNLLSLNLTTYVNRSRRGGMLEVTNRQLHMLSSFRQLT